MAACKIPIKMGLKPLKKNSTAITITIKPISRIIILFPVSPSIFMILEELHKTIKVIKQTIKIMEINMIFKIGSLASSIKTIELVIAPGPQIIGMAKGVMEMSETYFLRVDSLLIFTLTSLAWSMS